MRLLLLCAALAALSCGEDPDDASPTSTLPSASTPARPVASLTPPGICPERDVGTVLESGLATIDGAQAYRFVVRDDGGDEREVVLPPDTDPASCPDAIAETLALAFDGAIQKAAQDWVEAHGGELVGLCHPSLMNDRGDPAIRDYCSFLPLFVDSRIIVAVGRTQSDDTTSLVLEQQRDGSYIVVEERQAPL
jgi:hypothetical protein